MVGIIANGSVQIDDGSIPKLKAGGAHAAFALDSINYDGMYAAINAGFKVGDAFECEGTVALVFETGGGCIPDSVELVLGGDTLRIPLGAGPANVGYLTKMGGGVYNLYNTIKGYYNVIPPLTLKLISGYADPTLYSFQLETIALEFGLNGFQFTAEEGKIVGLKMIDGAYAKFLVYFTEYNGVMYPCVDIGAGISMNILDIIKGEASIWLVADPRIDSIFGNVSLGGKAYVGLFIPKYIPLIGGIELAAIMAELSTYRAFCGIRVIGIPVSVSYYWADKKVRFNDDFAYISQELNIPIEEIENAIGYQYVDNEQSNSSGIILFGGNMRETYSSKRSNDARLMAYDTKHEIEVKDQDYALFELQYTGDMPSISVTRPDGSEYILKENENYRIQTINENESKSGITEQLVYISVEDPENGIWTITTDKAVDCRAMDVMALPEIKNVSFQQVSNEQLIVNWDALNIDDSYTVDIHLSEIQKTVDLEDYEGNEEEYNKKMAEGYDPGIRAAQGIPAKNKEALVDIPERLTSGNYQVRVVLRHENEVYSSELSDEIFTYVNPNVPDMPQNIRVLPGGDGQFKVTYDDVANAQGYVVTILDENGNQIEGFEGITTDKTMVYIGNQSTVAIGYDENGNPTGFKNSGIVPGKSYRIKVYSYNEKNYITYTSEEYISDPIYLPVPNPAKVTLKVNDTTATKADGKNENTVGVTTNQSNPVVKYIPDQNVEVSYWVDGITNGEIYTVNADTSLEIPVELDDGGSVIDFLAVNENNDYTSSKLVITLDTVKPELLLNSSSVLSSNGRYEIVGTSEPNARVYIENSSDNQDSGVTGNNRTAVPVLGGSFTYIGTQVNTRDELKVTAVDPAGNETAMYVEVIPSELSSLKSLLIKDENNVNIEGIELNQGDTAKINVFGVSESGKEFKLDNNVSYSVIYGSDIVSVDENGVINAYYSGEAVIHCEYYITDYYSLESTINVTVKQPYGNVDIRISTTGVTTSEIGSPVARFSIQGAPIGVIYDYTIADNEYFELMANQLILKKAMDKPSVTISVTAQGKHVLDGVYEDIGTPITKEFTLNFVKSIVSMDAIDSKTVYSGTSFDNLDLPETVKVTLNTGEEVEYPVIWDPGAYNPDVATTYNLKGAIIREDNVINPNDLYALISVTVWKRSYDISPVYMVYEEDVTYKYDSEMLVLTAKEDKDTIDLGKDILDMETDRLKINFKNVELILDNDTVNALRDEIKNNPNSDSVSISVIQDGRNISVKIGNTGKVGGIIKVRLPQNDDEDANSDSKPNAYNMAALKDGKVITYSYYDETSGNMIFKLDGNGDYSIEERSFTFNDTENSWAKDIISYVAARGLVNGIGSNDFAPERNCSRAEFLKMILSATGIIAGTPPEISGTLPEDVKTSDWFAPYVGFAIEKGIVSGTGDGSFKPDKEITRQEMMVILNNCLEYLGLDLNAGRIDFKDKAEISDWAIAAVQKVTALGLIVGSEGNLMPLKNATRAECAAVMMRCIKLLT
ncbi:MAG TPA: hypothetical protein GXX20_03355 [Clostridiaceae bacterium]|nr:hypothetical protein [Clostridiaceae bacterium]